MFQGAAEGLRREGKSRVFVPEPPRHPRDGSCPWGGEETVQVFLFTVFLPKPCCSPNSLACFDARRDLVTTLGSCSTCEEEDRREISSDKEGIPMDLVDSRLYLKVLSVMKKADIESTINLCPILTT